MTEWLRAWWVTIRHTSRLTREGRNYRRNMATVKVDFDNPDAWTEVERP